MRPLMCLPKKDMSELSATQTDKQRKLAQLRKKKQQLRDKRAQAQEKFSQELHNINGEILRVKYDNKPGTKPKAKPAKKKPKSYIGL